MFTNGSILSKNSITIFMIPIFQTTAYQLIRQHYGTQRAERSQIPLINHINEGLLILHYLQADWRSQQAYCLHPLFQDDKALENTFLSLNINLIDTSVMLFVMEYRNIANQYLSHRIINELNEIKLSPLAGVNQMLIADKIQNRKDFELYHKDTHPHSHELSIYFSNWLKRLDISEEIYLSYKNILQANQSKTS